MQTNSLQSAKQAAGYAAVNFIQNGMIVGLGTGSTAYYFTLKLSDRCREGLKIFAVPTSEKTLKLAKENNIPLIDINTITRIDITVDGADEIDSQKRMIKGGGGALLREKIIAEMSETMVVVVDEYKLVKHLGKFPLPVEIVPFAYRFTISKIEELGYAGAIRLDEKGEKYITDNGNYIFDIHFTSLSSPEIENNKILNITGVVETGFFFNLAKKVIIGFEDGRVEIR